MLLQQAASSFGYGGLLFDLLRTLLALGGVCVLMWLSLRWLSRRGFGGAPARSDASLQVLIRLALEPRKNLYLVRVGKRVLLIGTGESGPPSLIAEIDDATLQSRADPDAPGGAPRA